MPLRSLSNIKEANALGEREQQVLLFLFAFECRKSLFQFTA